ncbi:hypothetical protein HD554DRAFT_2017800 [Boletus coccyginus]|nr:hypothetical protein HD554DRAFT_2017800 [Boletus coccyginus]
MFGESDSESPRVPSPWDLLTSPPSSPPKHHGTQEFPKLVPEAEEGNVEYKLQLLSPSPARFARLVTQLKWRLLEGGGQAYYELGVADCGTLVGLPRKQLEESLETLEMMAGEIGASVIIVKEIEVSPELSTLAESQLERWDGKSTTRRKDLLRMMKRDDESPATSATQLTTELSNTDVTDTEDSTCYSPITPPSSPGGEPNPTQLRLPHTPFPFDPALAMFTMNVEEDVADYADNEAADDDVPIYPVAESSVGLVISPVYKPRPMKKRAAHATHFENTKKRLKNGYPPSKSTNFTCHTANLSAHGSSETLPQPSGARLQFCGDRRDKGRELKLNAPLTHDPARPSTEPPTDTAIHHTIISCSTDEPDLSALESPHAAVVDPTSADASGITTNASEEPRIIVEVLVVRKLSVDEAFLDFEGFLLH